MSIPPKITRQALMQSHPVIRKLLASFQQTFFDPDYNDANDPAYDALNYPVDNDALFHGNYISMMPHGDIRQYPDDLAKKIRSILQELGCQELFILAFVKRDLFGRGLENEKELAQAKGFLKQKLETTSYQEAIGLHLQELEVYTFVYFWLSRLDAELCSYIFWVDEQQRFCFYICNRGNVHWLALHPESGLSEAFFKKHGLLVGADIDQF